MNRKLTLALIVAVVATPAAALAQPAVQRPKTRVPTLKVLNQRMPEVRFQDQPFEQVIEWLAEFMDMNIVVRWQQLEDYGVPRDTPISMQVRNLRMSQVLWLLLNEAAGPDLVLAYRASGNLLIISTEEDLGREMVTKVYDVADMLLTTPSTPRPDFQQQNQGLGQQGGGGGQSVFGTQNQQQQQDQNELANDVQLENIVNVIQSTVEPDSWAANGAGKGTIQTYKTLLIIRNTLLVHQQIGGYLSDDEVLGP